MLFDFGKRFRRFVGRNQFHPTWAGVWVNPFWLCRRELYASLARLAPKLEGKVLDFGCGSGPYRTLLSRSAEYIGLEYDTPENREHKNADVFYDGNTIPLDNAAVDAILSTQTLEHVPNPERIVGEWARVVRPGGTLLLTIPFMWPEHEIPYDFQRYTTYGLRKLLEEAGFHVMEQHRLLPDCRTPAQLFLAWLYDVLRFGSRRFATRIMLTALLFAPVALLATALARIAPKNDNTYMDTVVLAKRG